MTTRRRDTRKIDWAALDASDLEPPKRRVVGASWKERARQEHLAVGAFALIAQELAAEGCEPVILSLITKAAWDEVRHAEICTKMAVALLGPNEEVPAYYRGLPKVPMHDGADASTRVLLHVVEMCCFSETITGVYFTEMQTRATHATARAAIASLLADEIDHGRVGWAYLAARHRDGKLDGLEAALGGIVQRAVGRALAPRPGAADDPAMEAFGFLGNAAAREAVDRAVAGVIRPGLAQFGIALPDPVA